MENYDEVIANIKTLAETQGPEAVASYVGETFEGSTVPDEVTEVLRGLLSEVPKSQEQPDTV